MPFKTLKCQSCGQDFKQLNPGDLYCFQCAKKQNILSGGVKTMDHRRNDNRSSNDRRDRRDQHSKEQERYGNLPKHLMLESLFTETGAIKKQVYMETAENIAEIFTNSGISPTIIRKFFESVRAVHEKYSQDPQKNFDNAMASLYRIIAIANKSEDRGVTKRCFTDFLDHYVTISEKNERNLKGFKELFMSVVCYTKDKKDKKS